MAVFEIDKLLKNSVKNRILINIPGEQLVAFMIQDSFSIGGSASYESALDRPLAESLMERLGGTAGAIATLAQKAFQSRARSLTESILSYTGSEPPQFSLDLLFVAVRPTDDVRVPAYKLMAGTYPTMGTEGGGGWTKEITDSVLMRAPWGYKPLGAIGGSIQDAGGKLGVQIGSWFKATKQVLKDASFQFSKEVISTGRPLYAEGQITFSPHRMIDANELAEYFPGLGRTKE